MSDIVTRLMEANLLAVFNERDPQRRIEAIATTYAADVQWIDDDGVAAGHDALNAKAADLQKNLRGLNFIKAGAVRQTRGLGFLAWELRSPDGYTAASGFDVAEISGDRIQRLWTVLDRQE
ncbi:nuclear transport factor 2 family protein [Mycobacterium sp. Marseille-P9652]|uniref:nuclear transport factor 2 family protein n=1 Tax=Mycobacterium sp. Marseille-P9652 TaxID=2654950 RepID=UPI001E378C22|nr:nuclear transport factor 2 family protein [Mycobacterium sp. Marseille-P9652]